MAAPPEPVSVILPLPAEDHPARAEWQKYLHKTGWPDWELITPPLTPSGYGAAIRSGLESARHPLVLITSADYPYSPADLEKLIEKIDFPSEVLDPATGEWAMRKPDMAVGCRTGVPIPAFPKMIGLTYRTFCRIALGMPLEPLPGWYGFGEHLRAWFSWVVYGIGLHDPHCGFKLFRRSLLDRFPIQCDGDLVHIELVAKATFLTCLMDVVPLTPKKDPVPRAVWTRQDRRVLFGRPKFWKPQPSLVIGQ